ncbi:FAD binding domain-containing protein [Nocardia huaxiensis]|uniref:FAD binding domain-containing protein n=1 Tax=Nocardia huaxiensis TaxID=2755382 RepID=A0A7D6ZAE1_9NOCA|nr:FAD binding domain-containing protein [Nocardia huaxiensis]QLY28918.1 FAD binding domain-containing protein [Nocardia huaxiensis]UFS97607.1 FAD binding domain-containing protein [Nocardia huaxiensis]
MEFLRPNSWAHALELKAEHPDAVPIQGGTDVMVELNFDRHRPEYILDLNPCREVFHVDRTDGQLRIGSGVPYVKIINRYGRELPGLAQASRTVGSPQIRNRGTVGGNLGGASPAGDAHPALLAANAVVEAESAARGSRMIPIDDFYVWVKKNALEPDELIRAVWLKPATGPQYFAKVGTRNAMVIAVCSFAIALHTDTRTVGTGIGSAGPTPLRAVEAQEFLAANLPWDNPIPLAEDVAREFGTLAAAAAKPIDDVRGTADYRKHAVSVMARRTLGWAWNDYIAERRAA